MVVKITDENKADNKVEFKVVATSQYKDEEKRVKDDNNTEDEGMEGPDQDRSPAPRPIKITIKKLKLPAIRPRRLLRNTPTS